MDDKRYRSLAHEAFQRVLCAFDEVDVEDAEAEAAGDVVTITFHDGSRCVLSTQGATRQLWLAGAGQGWHFDHDEARDRWVDDRGRGEELFEVLRRIVKDSAGVDIAL